MSPDISKLLNPIVGILPRKYTVNNEEHPWNAWSLILVTLIGIDILIKLVTFWNAFTLIPVTLYTVLFEVTVAGITTFQFTGGLETPVISAVPNAFILYITFWYTKLVLNVLLDEGYEPPLLLVDFI